MLEYRGDGFIDDTRINDILESAGMVTQEAAREIIAKAEKAKGLSPYETAILLQNDNEEINHLILEAARKVKDKIYGRRLVLFAPLYLSNYCVNNCVYCGYRRDNREVARRRLSMREIREETIALEVMGHKRVVIETGEDPGECPIDYVVEAMNNIYKVKEGRGSVRRINVNIAATTVGNYRHLKDAGIGTYILFQETYHRETYSKMHPSGPKSNYDWHLTAMDRAMNGGIDDVGLGVLFGLYNYKYEVIGLLLHALHLEEKFGVGCHTISVPRLKPAYGVRMEDFPYQVSDKDFMKLIAVLRLSVPYTGIILSTREKPGFREQLFDVGVSQISAGSCTGVGGYSSRMNEGMQNSQFVVEDHRSLDEVVKSVCREGYLPSFCTACYRSGRTGDRFMELAKTGGIQYLCQPNALLTFQEFLCDYAGEETRKIGEETIAANLACISGNGLLKSVEKRLLQIKKGARDIYF